MAAMRFKYIWLSLIILFSQGFYASRLPNTSGSVSIPEISDLVAKRGKRNSLSPHKHDTEQGQQGDLNCVQTQARWWGCLGCAEEYGEQDTVHAFASLEMQGFPQNFWVRILKLFSKALI